MSYEVVRLGDVTNSLSNKRKPLNELDRNTMKEGILYPYYGANGIVDYINDYMIDEKVICIAEDGGSWGFQEKCSYIVNEKCWVNNHAHVLSEKTDKLILEYLFYYLNFSDLSPWITGTTRGKLTKGALDNLQIPLPPLDIQKKIADTLDKAQELIDKRKEQISALDKFLENLFLDMFGDPVSNPMGWERGTIRDIVSDVKYGSSSKANNFEGNYAMLRMNNITYSGGWDFSSVKYIELKENEIEKYTVNKNDILFNRTNSKELVGKTAVYRQDTPMAYAGYLIRVRPNEKANSEYISAYLNSKNGKTTLFNMCKSIVGQANINAQELQNININIPPLDLQNQFASIVEKVEAEKTKLKASLKEMEDNFNSIMQRAFKGELF